MDTRNKGSVFRLSWASKRAKPLTDAALSTAGNELSAAAREYMTFVQEHNGSDEVVPLITGPAQRLAAAQSAWAKLTPEIH